MSNRRFVQVDCSTDVHSCGKEYYKNLAKVVNDENAVAYFFNYLAFLEITVNLHDKSCIPQTKAQEREIAGSAPDSIQFIIDLADRAMGSSDGILVGMLPSKSDPYHVTDKKYNWIPDEKLKIPRAELYDEFLQWRKIYRSHIRKVPTQSEFTTQINKALGFKSEDSYRITVSKKQVWVFDLPKPQDIKSIIVSNLKTGV